MTACRFTSTTAPRVLKGRHDDDCPGDDCRGCQPCLERHCQVCGIAHVTVDGRGNDETCAECLAETRNDLGLIVNLAPRTLPEAIHRGIRSEAAMLAGAAIDTPAGIEAWGYRVMSAAMGRIAAMDEADERHPLWTLGSWEMCIREHLQQPSEARITLWAAADYIGEHLTRLAHDPEFAFDELAKALRQCRSHLEVVLHDQNQGDLANVGCFGTTERTCGGALERKLGTAGFADDWTCRRCGRKYTQAEYGLALRAKLEDAS